MKNKILLLITGCFMLLLTSCLNSSDDEVSTVLRQDAQISTFSLTNDSVPGLNSVKFTIDQLNGVIFNIDSMPYGTEVEKVVCKMTFRSYAIAAQMTPEATDSAFYWSESDSVDFSRPVKIIVTALDGATTKTYTAKLNIHQIRPDSMSWERYAADMIPESIDEQKVITCDYNDTKAYFMYVKTSGGYRLYYSPVSDARQWENLPLSGLTGSDKRITQITRFGDELYLPTQAGALYHSADGIDWSPAGGVLTVKYLLGVLGEGQGQEPVLAGIADDNGSLRFASMNSQQEWTTGAEVPDNFPVVNFAASPYTSMYHAYLMVFGGRDKDDRVTNTTWTTSNGTAWALITNSDSIGNPGKREGAMMARYDDNFFLIGGITAEGAASKEVYTSRNYGISWVLQDSLVNMPEGYAARGFSSIEVDDNNYMLIFSGKTSNSAKELNEIWRGRVNRLGY